MIEPKPGNKKEAPRRGMSVIGWREWVGLPDLGVERIKVKVDTGARSSALHVFGLQEAEIDGAIWCSFRIYTLQRSSKKVVSTKAKILEYRNVRNSGGKSERRPVIVTNVTLLGASWPVELTLANRDEMGFRMLLGRQAIRKRFLVDSGRSFYGGNSQG